MDNKKLINIAIIAVVLVAAWFIYQYTDKQGGMDNRSGQNPAPTPPSENVLLPSQQPGLSNDEKAALQVPGENATESQRASHLALVEKVAKEVTTVDVTNCKISPVVVKAREGSKLTFRNQGDAPVALTAYGDDKIYEVNSKQQIEINAGFWSEDSGLFGYHCSTGSELHQAMVYVVE